MKDTYSFDFSAGEFEIENGSVKTLSGIEALKMWVEKAIRTQTARYKMYKGKEYGANIEDLIVGKTYERDFTEAELKREIETALLRHEDINSITDFSLSREKETVNITLTLHTTYGEEEGTYDF